MRGEFGVAQRAPVDKALLPYKRAKGDDAFLNETPHLVIRDRPDALAAFS